MNGADWTKVGGVAGVVAAIAAVIALFPGGNDGSQPPSSTGNPGLAQAPGATSTVSKSAPAAPSQATPLLETEVTLPTGGAVDVDKSGQAVQRGQGGVTGPLDLYLDGGVYGIYASGDTYDYPTNVSTANAFDKCTELSDRHASTIAYVPSTAKGRAWCFTTSEGHLGWGQITAIADTSVTLKIRIWNK